MNGNLAGRLSWMLLEMLTKDQYFDLLLLYSPLLVERLFLNEFSLLAAAHSETWINCMVIRDQKGGFDPINFMYFKLIILLPRLDTIWHGTYFIVWNPNFGESCTPPHSAFVLHHTFMNYLDLMIQIFCFFASFWTPTKSPELQYANKMIL